MEEKLGWRAELSARRRALTDDAREIEAEQLAHTLSSVELGKIVCAYLPTRYEPGDIAMLQTMTARGIAVLLPVVTGDRPLDWAVYEGPKQLVRASLGVQEPTGARLGSSAIGTADTVLVPALAVDRRGMRLGKGGGFYDRSLPLARGRLVAVVRDEEVVDALPRQPHDIAVSAVLTPQAGLRVV